MSTEPTTEAGKGLGQRLARCYPPEEFEDWDAWVAEAEAEAREQGAREERERLRAFAETEIQRQLGEQHYSGEAMGLAGVLYHFTTKVVLADPEPTDAP